jgi:hypothetical protein
LASPVTCRVGRVWATWRPRAGGICRGPGSPNTGRRLSIPLRDIEPNPVASANSQPRRGCNPRLALRRTRMLCDHAGRFIRPGAGPVIGVASDLHAIAHAESCCLVRHGERIRFDHDLTDTRCRSQVAPSVGADRSSVGLGPKPGGRGYEAVADGAGNIALRSAFRVSKSAGGRTVFASPTASSTSVSTCWIRISLPVRLASHPLLWPARNGGGPNDLVIVLLSEGA